MNIRNTNQKVSVKQEKQNHSKANSSDTRKLHGKAQFAFALFTERNRQAKTNAAEQSRGSHDNRYNPSQDSQETIVMGTGNHTEEQIEKGKTDIKQEQKNVGDPSDLVEFSVGHTVGFFRTYRNEDARNHSNDCFDKCVQIQMNTPLDVIQSM